MLKKLTPVDEYAILFHPDNYDTIVRTEAVSPELMEKWMKECGPGNVYERAFGYRHYFVPHHHNFHQNFCIGATLIRSDFLEEKFEFDPIEINTTLTPIRQHSAL